MARNNEKAAGTGDAALHLNRQFRLAENARFLCKMPAFSTEEEMPNHLDELMRRLEKCERRERR